MLNYDFNFKINEEEVANNVAQILNNPANSLDEKEALKIIISCIDLTTLEGADTKEKVKELCSKAKSFSSIANDIPNVAAVCVYPTFASLVKAELMDSGIKTACVAGAFPSGQSSLLVKLEEVKYALDEGAEEIDMVISRGSFLEGEYQKVYGEIAAIKECCNAAHLKVILETGELKTLTNIRIASEIALEAGADFLKTSTGKITPAATETAFYIMCQAIKEHFNKTGKRIGIKAAGGISETDQAINYLKIVKDTLGNEWLNKDLFRIGASRLADKITAKLSV